MLKKIVIVIVAVAMCFLCGCSKDSQTLEKELSNVKNVGDIQLNKLTVFKWDKVFFIAPYTSKEEIENAISIKSEKIEDNNYDEDEVYMIFVDGNKIVYTIMGRTDNLGFCFELGNFDRVKELSVEKSSFSVSDDGDILVYTLK